MPVLAWGRQRGKGEQDTVEMGRICIDCAGEMQLVKIEPAGDEDNNRDFLTVECDCMVRVVEVECQDVRIVKNKGM